jgi:MFS family permease
LFNGSREVVWLGTIINIFTMTLAPSIAQAADLWGRKWFIVVTTVFGFVGCLIVSRAQSMAMVLAGYAVLAVAYGGQALLFAIVSEVLPRKQRPHAQAVANVTAGFGAILGLCMGGALLKNGIAENYRIYFYVNAAIFAASSVLFIGIYNPPPRLIQQSLTRSQKLRQLDWVGYAILPPALTLLSVGLSYANNPYSWRNVHTLAPLVCGIALGIIFIIYEVRVKKDGMLHHSLFEHRNFAIALAAICAEGFIFFSCNNYFTFEFGVFQQANLLEVALTFVIFFGVSIVTAMITGLYASRRKVVRTPLVMGFLFVLVFTILMATSNQNTSGTAFRGYSAFAGAGFGVILPVILTAAQLSTPPDQIALASGLMVASRGVGGIIGLSVNDAIFHAALSKLGSSIAAATLPLGLPPSSLGSLIAALASGNPSAFLHIEGATPQIIGAGASALLDVYALGFRNIWICAGCLTLVTAIRK